MYGESLGQYHPQHTVLKILQLTSVIQAGAVSQVSRYGKAPGKFFTFLVISFTVGLSHGFYTHGV